MKSKLLTTLASAALGALLFQSMYAVPITAYELIKDLNLKSAGASSSSVDLQRVRFNGTTTTTENTDSSITSSSASGNDVDSDFGQYNDHGVDYVHRLSWASPGTLTSATLTIMAYDVNGNNDSVTISISGPDIDLGDLTGGASGQTTTTTFTTGVGTFTLSLLSGGSLALQIDKSNNDDIEIFSSKLSFTWDDGTSAPGETGGAGVPDAGASLALLGLGLLGLGALRRKLG